MIDHRRGSMKVGRRHRQMRANRHELSENRINSARAHQLAQLASSHVRCVSIYPNKLLKRSTYADWALFEPFQATRARSDFRATKNNRISFWPIEEIFAQSVKRRKPKGRGSAENCLYHSADAGWEGSAVRTALNARRLMSFGRREERESNAFTMSELVESNAIACSSAAVIDDDYNYDNMFYSLAIHFSRSRLPSSALGEHH